MIRRDSLWPLAEAAGRALFYGVQGDVERARSAHESVVVMGDEAYLLAVCAWTAALFPDSVGWARVKIVGPPDDITDRLRNAGAIMTGVVNRDISGVVAAWAAFSTEEKLAVGLDVFGIACGAMREYLRKPEETDDKTL